MVNIRPLPPLLAKIAIEELNERPERIQDDLAALRTWIEKQPHLNVRTSDQFLIAFLRGSKYSLERAKLKIDKYYSLRHSIPELFKNRKTDDPKILDILRLGVALRLPLTKGEDGPRIAIIRCGAYDPSKYTMQDMMKMGTIIADIQMLEDDNSVISGLIEILDMGDVTPGHLFQLDMNFIKKLSIYSEEGMPIRQKGFHFINTPPTFETLYNVFQTFMSEKSKNRLFVHGNMDSFYKHIPKQLLPIEYGGENGTIQDIIDTWEKKFLSYRDYFIEEEKYGSNEKLRIGGTITTNNYSFGTDGSFRKLNVD